MPENEPEGSPVTPSYAEYKASIRDNQGKPPETAADPKPPVETSAPPAKPDGEKPENTDASDKRDKSAPPAKPEAKTAEETDASDKDTQEEKDRKAKERRDRSAEGKIRELTAAQAREKERADRLEKELEEARKANAAPVKPTEVKTDPPPAAAPAPKVPLAADKDPKPLFKQITELAAQGDERYAGKEYEELQDAWSAEVDAWREREAERKVHATEAVKAEEAAKKRLAKDAKTAEERKKVYVDSVEATKAEYPDFDQVVKNASAKHPITNDGVGAAMAMAKNPGRLLYELCQDDGAEFARIAEMPEDEAFRETLWLDRQLTSGAPKKTESKATAAADPPPAERPKPAISQVPRPPRIVNGVEDSSPNKPLSSYAEAKRKWNEREIARPRA